MLIKLTVALVTVYRASCGMISTSGELFMMVLTLAKGRHASRPLLFEGGGGGIGDEVKESIIKLLLLNTKWFNFTCLFALGASFRGLLTKFDRAARNRKHA